LLDRPVQATLAFGGTMNDRVLVIVKDGRVFAHDVTGNAVAPGVQLA
jgi:hypothetical protein